MATVKAVIDTRFSKRKNGYQILIRIQHSSKKKEDVGLGEYVSKVEYFDKIAGKVKKRKGIDYERINALILEKILYYQERLKGNNQFNVSIKSKESVLAEFEYQIAMLDSDGKYNSKRMYSYSYKYLTEYLQSVNKTSLDVHDIDIKFLGFWKIYMKGKGLGNTTMKAYIDKLRTCYYNKCEELNLPKRDFFKKITFDKEKITNTLNEDIFKKFEKYIPKPGRIIYKQMFLTQFYLQGTRIGCIMGVLKWKNLEIFGLEKVEEIDEFSTISEVTDFLKKPLKECIKKTDYKKVTFKLKWDAYKTGKEHLITLSNKAIMQFRYFLDKDLQLRFLEQFKDDELSIYLGVDLQNRYSDEELNNKLFGINNLNIPDDSCVDLMKELIVEQYNRDENKPMFHDWDFEGLEGNDLKKFVQSKTTYINKALTSISKEPYYEKRIKQKLSSHDSRRLFSILFFLKYKDIYILSKLLFHANIGITERYLKKLDVELHSVEDALDFYYNL